MRRDPAYWLDLLFYTLCVMATGVAVGIIVGIAIRKWL